MAKSVIFAPTLVFELSARELGQAQTGEADVCEEQLDIIRLRLRPHYGAASICPTN